MTHINPEPMTENNTALVLVDHQVGLMTGVRDYPVAELRLLDDDQVEPGAPRCSDVACRVGPSLAPKMILACANQPRRSLFSARYCVWIWFLGCRHTQELRRPRNGTEG